MKAKKRKKYSRFAWAVIGRFKGKKDIPLSSISHTKMDAAFEAKDFNYKDLEVIRVEVREI